MGTVMYGPTGSRSHIPSRIERCHAPTACAAFASDADTSHGSEPVAVAKPHTTEEVVALLAWANDQRVGIVPVSSTGRRRRGDTVPRSPGVVVADLSGMSRLIHADASDKVAILEPGIDFGTVDRLLAPHGLRAPRPLMPRAGKSVLASYLDREPPINANDHWNSCDPFGGANLVLGDGHATSVDPLYLDLLRVIQGSQGTLGVVTQGVVHCERLPSLEDAWFCSAEELQPTLDLAREILRRRLGNAVFIVDRWQLAMMLLRDTDSFHALAVQLPTWTLFVSVSASMQRPAEKMRWQRHDVLSCAAMCGAEVHEQLLGRSAAGLLPKLRCADPVSFRDRPLGAHGELFFEQQLHRVKLLVELTQKTVAAAGWGDDPLGVYLQPKAQGVSCHIEFTLPFDPSLGDGVRAGHLLRLAAERCAEAGAFFSRPHGVWRDQAFSRDASILPLMRTTKATLDPNGVMNPGRFPY